MKFRAQLQLHGKTATGLTVPAEVVAGLGAGKRPAVVVTLNRHTYRSTIASMGGQFLLPVSAEQRELAGVAAGDWVTVTVELDQAPRTVEVPADLAAALAKQKGARAAFDAAAPSARKEFVRQVETAKAAETRARRIAAIVAKLSAPAAGRKKA